jgi:hypothetical protein
MFWGSAIICIVLVLDEKISSDECVVRHATVDG